jgi:hypothetical protein
MKRIESAKFSYLLDRLRAHVTFLYTDGQPTRIVVEFGTDRRSFDNRKGRWKPCMTHVKELIGECVGKPEKNEFAKQRISAEKPGLNMPLGSLRIRRR